MKNRSISKNEIVACCHCVTHGLLEAGHEVSKSQHFKNEIVACWHFVTYVLLEGRDEVPFFAKHEYFKK